MKLVYKAIIPSTETNSNGSTKGGFIFELMDFSGVTYLNELFVNQLPENEALVTNEASIKYISSVFAHDYIEIFADLISISPGNVTVNVELHSRDKKSTEWKLSANAVLSFTIINTDTRRVVRIPREIINAIKG